MGFRRERPSHRDDESRRTGELAVKKGYLDPSLLEVAIKEQDAEDAAGWAHRPLGQILLEHGWLTPWELEDIRITIAELAAGVDRTGETPSDAIPLPASDDDLFDTWPPAEDRDQARRYPRSIATAAPRTHSLVGDVVARVPIASTETRLEDALEAAFDTGAEALIVLEDGELAGVLSVWEHCQTDRDARVGDLMSPHVATVNESSPIAEAARILRARPLPCVVVLVYGRPVGVVTRRSLRRAGVANVDAPELAYAELGGGD